MASKGPFTGCCLYDWPVCLMGGHLNVGSNNMDGTPVCCQIKAVPSQPASFPGTLRICVIMEDSARPGGAAVQRHTDELQTHERLRASRRPAGGHRAAFARHRGGREASGAARRHRLGKDVHRGQGDRARQPARPWCSRTTRRSPRSSTANSRVSSRRTPSNISSAITITTSRKPTFPLPTPTSKKNPRSTTNSTSCA